MTGARTRRPVAARPIGGLWLVIVCGAVYLPGFFSLPPVDRDESRFAQASRQMLEAVTLDEWERDPALHGGGLVVPMLGERPRLNKPPLIYWLQAGSAAVFTGGDPLRDAIWMYRVPSLLAALAAVLATWRIGLTMFDPRVAWLAGAMLGVCPLIAWEARQARADMVLLAITTVAMWGLWGLWKGQRDRGTEGQRGVGQSGTRWGGGLWWVVVWVSVGFGVLVKGPITPMVVLLTALAMSLVGRHWGWFWSWRMVVGVGLVALMVGPWVVGVARHVGWDAYVAVISDEVIGRSAAPKEGHWGPPGYHLALMVVLFWPGSMLAGYGVVRGVWRGLRATGGVATGSGWLGRSIAWVRNARPGRPAECFLLAWLVPSWIVFELVSTKLPHYTMPMYPALALLSARGVYSAASHGGRAARHGLVRAGFALWNGVGLVLTAASFIALVFPGVLGLFLFARTFRSLRAGRLVAAQGWSLAWAASVIVGIIAIAGSSLFGLSSRVIGAAEEIDPAGERPLAAIEFHEDSLEFLTRTRVERINADGLGAWLEENPNGLVIVPARTSLDGAELEPIASIPGIDYAGGSGRTVIEIREVGP